MNDWTEYMEQWVDAPRWGEATKVHDWRNHVPDEIQKNWFLFDPEQRRLLIRWADGLASNENWE